MYNILQLSITIISLMMTADGATHIIVDGSNGHDIHTNTSCMCGVNGCKTLQCAVQYSHVADSSMLYIGIKTGVYKPAPLVITRRNTALYGVSGDRRDVTIDVTDTPSRFSTILTVGSDLYPGVLTNVSISDIEFVGAWDSAIYCTGMSTVRISNIAVTESRVEAPIYIDRHSDVWLSDSTFTNNGELVSESVVSVRASSFYARDCIFHNNHANRVLYLLTGEGSVGSSVRYMNLTDISITSNGLMGIEINAQKRPLYATFERVKLDNNGLANNADPLRVSSTMIPPRIVLRDCTITNNFVAFAGINVVPSVRVDLYVYDSLISRNSGGSGIFKQGKGMFVLYNTEVSWNDNEQPITAMNAGGGGLQVAGEVMFKNVTIHRNLASQGGGIFIGTEAADVTIVDSVISDNTASGDGSAIFTDCESQQCSLRIIGTTFSKNEIVAQSVDGAVNGASMLSTSRGSVVNLYNCSIECDNEPNNLVCDSSSVVYVDAMYACGKHGASCRSQTVVVAAVLITIMVLIAFLILASVWYKRWLRKKAEGSSRRLDSEHGNYTGVHQPWESYTPPEATPRRARSSQSNKNTPFRKGRLSMSSRSVQVSDD